MNKELIQKTRNKILSNIRSGSREDWAERIDKILSEVPATEEAPLQRPYDIFNGQVLMKSLVDRGNEEDLNGFAVVKIIDSKLSSRSGTASTTYLRYDAVIKEVNTQMKSISAPLQEVRDKEEGEKQHYEALLECCQKLLNKIDEGKSPARYIAGLRILMKPISTPQPASNEETTF